MIKRASQLISNELLENSLEFYKIHRPMQMSIVPPLRGLPTSGKPPAVAPITPAKIINKIPDSASRLLPKDYRKTPPNICQKRVHNNRGVLRRALDSRSAFR